MTTKVQFRREHEGLMEDVNPITSEECVILEDGRKLSEALNSYIYIDMDLDTGAEEGLTTKDGQGIVTKDGQTIEVLGEDGSITVSELQEKLVIADTDYLVVEDRYYTRKATKGSLLREVNGRVDSVEERLQEIDNLLNPFEISLSVNQTIAEMGSTINQLNFTWAYNKNIILQRFNGETLENDLRSTVYNSPLASNKTFTLSATSTSNETKSKSVSVSFLNGVYYGVSSTEDYDSQFILSLTKTLSNSRSRTITVKAGAEDYIYYCTPVRLGDCTFTVGGFTGGFSKVKTFNFTNAHGYTESYNIWKSDNKGLGETKITIS